MQRMSSGNFIGLNAGRSSLLALFEFLQLFNQSADFLPSVVEVHGHPEATFAVDEVKILGEKESDKLRASGGTN